MKKSKRSFLSAFLYSWVIMSVISLIWGDGTVLARLMYCEVMSALAGLVWVYLLSLQRCAVQAASDDNGACHESSDADGDVQHKTVPIRKVG